MKKLAFTQTNLQRHWVGDGFPVRTLFSYHERAEAFSPFLLLDYAGPENFSPTHERRGVGAHPHRGFETVTIVYDGEVEHRDSAGGGGMIRSGDVQWMTAASGIVHEEFHGPHFAKSGGPFEMVQLWVNLPKKDKAAAPGYQSITSDTIPTVPLADDAGSVRIIAGKYAGGKGPARTFTPMNVWDVRIRAGRTVELPAGAGDTTVALVLRGSLRALGERSEPIHSGDLAVFERTGSGITLTTDGDEEAKVLVLSGRPIDEPIVGHGPFVMNTEEEINQAFVDFHRGKMGRI